MDNSFSFEINREKLNRLELNEMYRIQISLYFENEPMHIFSGSVFFKIENQPDFAVPEEQKPDENAPADDELDSGEHEDDHLPTIIPPDLPPSDFDRLREASPPPEEEADFFWFWLDMAWQRTAINIIGLM